MIWTVAIHWDNDQRTSTTVSDEMRMQYLGNLPWERIKTIVLHNGV